MRSVTTNKSCLVLCDLNEVTTLLLSNISFVDAPGPVSPLCKACMPAPKCDLVNALKLIRGILWHLVRHSVWSGDPVCLRPNAIYNWRRRCVYVAPVPSSLEKLPSLFPGNLVSSMPTMTSHVKKRRRRCLRTCSHSRFNVLGIA